MRNRQLCSYLQGSTKSLRHSWTQRRRLLVLVRATFRDIHVLQMRPSQEFAYESGRRQLEDVQHLVDQLGNNGPSMMDFVVPCEEDMDQDTVASLDLGLSTRRGRTLRLSSVIDLDSKLSVGCSGALLLYLQQRKAGRYLPREFDTANMFRVSALDFFSLDNVMYYSLIQKKTRPY